MSRKRISERLRAGCRQPMQMRRERDQSRDRGNPRGRRAEIGASLRMTNRSEQKADNEKRRIVFTQHRERGGCAGGNGPAYLASFKRPQEAIGSDWPCRQQNRVGIEPLSVKLVGRQQHQKQQHDNSLVTSCEASRDQIDGPQRDRRIGQRHQLKRPIVERKDRSPSARDPSHQRGMFGIAPFDAASERPCFQDIGVQIAAEIGGGEISQPNRDKSDQQKRNSPTRFDTIQPDQKRPPPTRGGNFRARSHLRERKVHGTQLIAVRKQSSILPSLGERRRRPIGHCYAARLCLLKKINGPILEN